MAKKAKKAEGLTTYEKQQIVRIELQAEALEKNAKALGKASVELKRLGLDLPLTFLDTVAEVTLDANEEVQRLNDEKNAILQKAPLFEEKEEKEDGE